MARPQATAAAAAPLRRSARGRIKEDITPVLPKQEAMKEEKSATPQKPTPSKSRRRDPPNPSSPPRQAKRIKAESKSPASPPPSKSDALRARKLAAYTQHAGGKSPFPDFPRPTAEECARAHRILTSLHGDRARADAKVPVEAPRDSAGCGASPSVLDALVRTILSQNTSDANSSRAKRSLDATYGSSDAWAAIAAGGPQKLEAAIRSGGLARVKSRVILAVLEQTMSRHGSYSLDHLFARSDDEAMRELLGMRGVGPKTAGCVLLFCLRRESFAVDTHVYRITGLLGWRPEDARCGREEAQAHLEARVPDELKYPLHVLLVGHGKVCAECRAGGRSRGECPLRRAFRGGKGEEKGEGGEVEEEGEEEGGEEVKEEEMKEGGKPIKEEDA